MKANPSWNFSSSVGQGSVREKKNAQDTAKSGAEQMEANQVDNSEYIQESGEQFSAWDSNWRAQRQMMKPAQILWPLNFWIEDSKKLRETIEPWKCTPQS